MWLHEGSEFPFAFLRNFGAPWNPCRCIFGRVIAWHVFQIVRHRCTGLRPTRKFWAASTFIRTFWAELEYSFNKFRSIMYIELRSVTLRDHILSTVPAKGFPRVPDQLMCESVDKRTLQMSDSQIYVWPYGVGKAAVCVSGSRLIMSRGFTAS